MQPYVICTDTGADLPLSAAVTNKVELAHLHYIFDDQAFTYAPGKDAELSALYTGMRGNTQVQTKPVSADAFYALWEPHLVGGRDVLMLSISRYLSETFHNAQQARGSLLQKYPKRKILLLDTMCAGAAQGMLVHEAALRKEEGEDLFAVAEWVVENRDFVNSLILPGAMKWLRDSGYFSGGALGELLGKKLLLGMDETGNLQQIARVKDDDAATIYLLDIIKQIAGNSIKNQVVAITHSDAPSFAAKIRAAIINDLGAQDAAVFPMGPVVGSHIGPDSIGIAFFGRSRKK